MPRVHSTRMTPRRGVMAGGTMATEGVSAGAMAKCPMAGRPGAAGEMTGAAMLGRVMAPMPGGCVMASLVVTCCHPMGSVAVMGGDCVPLVAGVMGGTV